MQALDNHAPDLAFRLPNPAQFCELFHKSLMSVQKLNFSRLYGKVRSFQNKKPPPSATISSPTMDELILRVPHTLCLGHPRPNPAQIIIVATLAFASAGYIGSPVLVAHPAPVVHSVPVVPVVKTAPVLIKQTPLIPVVKAAPIVAVHSAPVITKTIQAQSIVHPAPVVHAAPVLVHH
ncbi:hypothetical protein HUJ05_002354 [Dendroctonus ponderosae]|nr:hypothetical protein HUJ05_002354 [Dendroctonus ponderosae]